MVDEPDGLPSSSLADSCHCHHSPGLHFFGAIGEQLIGVAVGAERRDFDAPRRDAPGEQLPAVRLRGSVSESLPVTLRILTPGCFETHHRLSNKR